MAKYRIKESGNGFYPQVKKWCVFGYVWFRISPHIGGEFGLYDDDNNPKTKTTAEVIIRNYKQWEENRKNVKYIYID